MGSSEKLSRFNDIFEIEAIGPLVLLENFLDMFRGSLWLQFLDNAAALSNLVNRSSSVIQGGHPHWRNVEPNTAFAGFPMFDRVDSKSNLVDGLSRGRLDGPWKVESLAFPVSPSSSTARARRERGLLSQHAVGAPHP